MTNWMFPPEVYRPLITVDMIVALARRMIAERRVPK